MELRAQPHAVLQALAVQQLAAVIDPALILHQDLQPRGFPGRQGQDRFPLFPGALPQSKQFPVQINQRPVMDSAQFQRKPGKGAAEGCGIQSIAKILPQLLHGFRLGRGLFLRQHRHL